MYICSRAYTLPAMAFNNLIIIIFSVCVFATAIMATTISPGPEIFFKEKIAGNLTKVTWAHAVNNKTKLNEVLMNDEIMMLEADVVIGKLINGTNESIPIMAHSSNTSDLSLKDFLERVLNDGKRGIKLDCKTIEAFKASLPILKQFRENMTFPVWINADILPGPVNAQVKPVDANQFLNESANAFHESTLSIGWTTKYVQHSDNITSGSYTQQQIEEMIDILSRNNVTQTVTYPVRASMAVNSITLWTKLMEKTKKNKPTLTIWSDENDYVDAKQLSKLIKNIGVDKVYVDIPNKLWKELNISSSANNLNGIFMVIAIITASTILFSFS